MQDATRFCLSDAGRKRYSQNINIKTVGACSQHLLCFTSAGYGRQAGMAHTKNGVLCLRGQACHAWTQHQPANLHMAHPGHSLMPDSAKLPEQHIVPHVQA